MIQKTLLACVSTVRYFFATRFPNRLLFLGYLLLLTAAGLPPAHADELRRPLSLGVFAYLGIEETQAIYAPLVEHLNSILTHERIVLHVLSQEDIYRGVAAGKLDIVTTNPTHFLVIRKQFPLTGVIATRVTERLGKPVHHLAGVIITRASQENIRTLADIRGKHIATPSTQHMGGYRAQAYTLFKEGIVLPDDAASLRAVETHQAVIKALRSGEADVGFVREGVLEMLAERGDIRLEDFRVIHPQQHPNFPFLASTQLYPEWPVFALPHVPERAVRRLAAALFSLDPNHPAVRAAGIAGYTVPADYLQVEELSRTLRLPPFDHNLDITWADIWQKWRLAITVGIIALVIILIMTLLLTWLVRRERASRKRTQALLEALQESNTQLIATRNQLVQSEKLASIGQLAAGVAHEINNPIGFVTGNLGALENYVADLLRLVEAGQHDATVRALAEELDLPFLREDVQALLRESREGLVRVRKIVLDLQDFSRVSESHWEKADLNQCLEATLNLLGNQLKSKCTLHTDLGKLPQVLCLPTQLNQAFVNLLLNANQAISTQGDIFISSRFDPENAQIQIRIRDTGCGITPEHLPQIFDPFFTTKPVGQGTGLGLSLVWGIVERHNGQITVDSTPGKGSEFLITLPARDHAPLPGEGNRAQ